MYAAALFDLDGTLLDTGEGVLGSVRTVVEEHGVPPLSEESLCTFIGPPIQHSFARTFGLSVAEADSWAARFRELYSSQNLLKARLYDGILDVFAGLQERNVPIAVATYKREDYALELLRYFGFDAYTPYMFGSDKEGKLTKADIIRKAAQAVGVPSQAALMVGDTDHDALGAAHAGMPFLAVTYGYGFRAASDAACYRHVGVVDTPKQILEYF